MALVIPATISRLNPAASSGASFFTGASLLTGSVAFDWTSVAVYTARDIQLTSLIRFPLGPMRSVLSFSADPYAFWILPMAAKTSPFVSIPPRPVPFSFKICSLDKSDSSSLESQRCPRESRCVFSSSLFSSLLSPSPLSPLALLFLPLATSSTALPVVSFSSPPVPP